MGEGPNMRLKMAKVIIDITKTNRKNKPLDIEIITAHGDTKEILLLALKAVFDYEKEKLERKEMGLG